MIEARFDQIDEILYIHNDGHTAIDELVKKSDDFIRNNILPDNLRILEFANAEIAKTPAQEWKKIKDVLNMRIQHFSSIRHAIISLDPVIVANVMLIEQEINQSNYTLKIFSTETAARRWLLGN